MGAALGDRKGNILTSTSTAIQVLDMRKWKGEAALVREFESAVGDRGRLNVTVSTERSAGIGFRGLTEAELAAFEVKVASVATLNKTQTDDHGRWDAQATLKAA